MHQERLLASDQEVRSFEQFYRDQRGRAVQLAWLLTRDRSIAEDVAQDAFAAVFSRFEFIREPDSYLRRSIVNGVRERARRSGRERRREVLATTGQDRMVEIELTGLIDAIHSLPLKQRTAVVLHYWAGMTDREIGDIMSMRPSSVRSTLSRATAQLRKEVTP